MKKASKKEGKITSSRWYYDKFFLENCYTFSYLQAYVESGRFVTLEYWLESSVNFLYANFRSEYQILVTLNLLRKTTYTYMKKQKFKEMNTVSSSEQRAGIFRSVPGPPWDQRTLTTHYALQNHLSKYHF